MSDASMLNWPGPRSEFRLVLPKVAVVSAVCAKHDVLNHLSIVGSLSVGSQIVFGRLVMPVDSMLCVCVTFTGRPERRYRRPFTCQPPHGCCAAQGSS